MSSLNSGNSRETIEKILSEHTSEQSQEWTPEFAGGDAWRIGGSPCSYGYLKQQAMEICDAHNAALAAQAERFHKLLDEVGAKNWGITKKEEKRARNKPNS